ncbi:hypothetical protein Ahy_B03g068856 isoform B [Arachis hypogaea]|uniref:Uncharacterized protein n=1 Tax=Arachis hypogaea TaxID=3818 RepID=A0A445ABK5_ARAHY|nr:hypothetical protein Ahy_B03g068856 isoform B [Arachis hypogaea]
MKLLNVFQSHLRQRPSLLANHRAITHSLPTLPNSSASSHVQKKSKQDLVALAFAFGFGIACRRPGLSLCSGFGLKLTSRFAPY